ncbi:MAG: CHAT domain-containing protein [Cyclobacteriaceae bacterium]|nr:CHAT domain-containing protein [Cyclobacteriaceae bacterium]
MKFHTLFFVLIPGMLFSQTWEEVSKKAGQAYHAGQFEKAIELTREAISLAEKEFGTKHENYFTSIGDYATILKKSGRYFEARKIEEENLQSINQTLGKENLVYVTALKNLGNTFLAQEEYQSAELTYQEAIHHLGKIIERKDDYYTSHAFQAFDAFVSIGVQLGLVYQRIGKPELAETNYSDLVDFCKNFLGEDYSAYSPYATLINNLANLYIDKGDLDKAEQYLNESLRISEHLYGVTSPYYLQTQINLAQIYSTSEREEQAEKLLKEILEAIKQTQGAGSTDYITVLNNLAGICFGQERYEESERYTLEALQWQDKIFGKENAMYQTLVHNLAETYQWMNRFDEADKLYKVAVAKVLRDVEKNFTYLTESEKRNFYLQNLFFVEEYANFALYKSGVIPLSTLPREQLSKSSLADLYDLRLNTKALVLNATEKMKQQLFSSGDSALVARYRSWEKVKEEIAKQYNLPSASRLNIDSLIQLAENYERVLNSTSASFRKGFVNQSASWKEIQIKLKPGEAAVEIIRYFDGLIYVALIITPQTVDHPEVALIKSTKTRDLEKGFLSYYKNAIHLKLSDTVSYNQFWKPVYDTLKKYSSSVKKVYLSPDGMFNEININTLLNPVSKKYVIDETEIHLLTNTRELLNLNTSKKNIKRSAVLIGRPNYGNSRETVNDQLRNSFTDLKGTETEVKEIAALLENRSWNTTIYIGDHATEENLKSIDNPQVLHIATHGYFIPPDERSSKLAYVETMLHSGIILAYASNPRPGMEDGILTAYEAMSLNLDTTQLVVLSACETGLGTIEAGEGVYGLQRTLKVAGAKTILMSLWKVDDTATQELMQLLYQKWLKGKSIRNAFRLAQVELKRKYPEPYYWGAFVMTGD